MSSTYFAYNGPVVTTAPFAPVTTGTATKTMLQVAAGSASALRVVKWGISFDGTGTTPIKCELLHTGTVAATVTAHVASGVQPYGADQSASTVTLGTGATGYTATVEGTITTSRYGDAQWVLPGNYFQNEWSLGREFFVPGGGVVRIRVNTGTAVNCVCWMIWEE